MQSNYHFSFLLSLIFTFASFLGQAQSVHFPKSHQAYHYFDRMDIKLGLSHDIHSSIKQLDRKAVTKLSMQADSLDEISLIDKGNIDYLRQDNLEWVSDWRNYKDLIESRSRTGLFKSIYTSPANFLAVRNKDLDLFINPIINFKLGYSKIPEESNSADR